MPIITQIIRGESLGFRGVWRSSVLIGSDKE